MSSVLQVTREEASQWCEQIGAQYREVSAMEDLHVTEAFLEAARAGFRQVRASEMTPVQNYKKTSSTNV